LLKRYGQAFLVLLILLDLLAIAVAWFAASRLFPSSSSYPTVMSALLGLLVYSRVGLYVPKRTVSLAREAMSIQQGVFLSWCLTYVCVSLSSELPHSRRFMICALAFWLVLAFLTRMLGRTFLRYLRSRGYNLRRAAIVGAGRLGQRLHATLSQNSWTGIEVSYFLDDGPTGRTVRDCSVLGCLESIETTLQQYPVDIVFVALSKTDPARLRQIVDRLSEIPVDLRVVPDLLAVQFLRHDVTLLDDLPVISLTDSPQTGWNSSLKSVFDRMAALVALSVFLPPMALIAILVKFTDAGPVFYRQTRAGLGGKPFEMLKFRTMRLNAEAATGPVWAVPNDPRVTPFGRLLRRTSLDELPQLINVLRGEMSLVGPRPERPELIGRLKDRVPRYVLRHHVKPGMTGWAQIHGMRGDTSLRKRIQYDLFYVKNWSFAMDLWILLLTPVRGLVNANAY
jgi:putative colanic acid biosynthesis UDP-glucose lipid carrier transferase